ncbi:acyltransferase family protein [Pseudarthrobacter sp. NPDC092424]|uniref:acyltransferase family protein n=1 Tax=Pseudarthrobacter sp. NPDC092424 TaxID=3364415 RepID=UPI003808436E
MISNPALVVPAQESHSVSPSKTGRYQPEIQGLRALAVLVVVLYHLWPNRLSGGYVGVDVFFVISGYLITSHMYREVERTGRVALVQFWARRIRRLLPASIFVLGVSLLGVFLWMPATVWEVSARQVAASALYVQNWILANDAVDYSAMHNDATVAQHYWSLSVEEQFYLAWPVTLMGVLFLARRSAKRSGRTEVPSPRTTLIRGIALVGAASLAYSILLTAQSQATAYFVTPTRVWEFAAGALVSLLFLDRQFTGKTASLLAWAGIALICISSFAYGAATPFPGWTATLPVAGTALVLVCAGSGARSAPAWWLSRRPMTFLGDVSYGLYLWHWPLIVLGPYILGQGLGLAGKVLVLVLSVLLAWLTKIVVEDPLRRGKLLRASWRPYAFAAGSSALVAALCFGLATAAYASSGNTDTRKLGVCYGPGALQPANDCGPVSGMEAPSPGPATVAKQNTEPAYKGCQTGITESEVLSCNLGVDKDTAETTVAIVGDSHATAWFAAMDELAKLQRWHVKTYTKGSCPASTAIRVLPSETTDEAQRTCVEWNRKVNAQLEADRDISTVFTASYSTAYTFKAGPDSPTKDPAVDGFKETWRKWMDAGKEVVAFDDVPRTNGEFVPTCLANNPDDPLACAVPRTEAYPANTAIGNAGRAMRAEGVRQISLREQFCDEKICYPVVGSMIVYRDYSHLSAEYSKALVPYILEQL